MISLNYIGRTNYEYHGKERYAISPREMLSAALEFIVSEKAINISNFHMFYHLSYYKCN